MLTFLLVLPMLANHIRGNELSSAKSNCMPNFHSIANSLYNKLTPPTGILYDKQLIPFIDITKYSGDSLNHDTCDAATWRQLYFEIYNSYIGSPDIPSLKEVDEMASETQKQNKVPLLALFGKYNKIKKGAVDKGLIIYDKTSLYENTSKTENPYLEETIFAITTQPSILYGPTHTFKLGPIFFPNGLTFPGIPFFRADFGDGNGYQPVGLGVEYTISYPSYGKKTISLMYGYIYPEPIINVMGIAQCNFWLLEPAAEPNIQATQTSAYPWNNKAANYEFSVLYGTGHTSLQKPLLFIEGFDPSNTTNYPEIYWRLNGQNLINRIRSLGYDVIIMNYSNGGDYIQRNGLALVDLIEWVNSNKTTNEKNVVVGASMGGLVSRYALSYMEYHGLRHDTRLYVSFDSPHQGANIPLATQAWVNYLSSISSSAQDGVYQLNTPAAQQLLVYHYNYINNGDYYNNIGCSPLRTNLLNELFQLGNYPDHFIRKVSIANGSGVQLAQMGKTIRMEDRVQIMDWEYEAPAAVAYISLNSFAVPDSRSWPDWDNIFYGTFYSNEPVLDLLDEEAINLPDVVIKIKGTREYDNAPGGYAGTVGALMSANYKKGTWSTNYPNHCFVPTVSAMDLRIPTTNEPANLFSNANSSLIRPGIDTPFESWYTESGENIEHVTITSLNADFFIEQLTNYNNPFYIDFETVKIYVKENQIAYSQDVSSQSAVRTGTDGTVVPHSGTWMYKITGNDIGGVENGYCYWNLTSIPVVVTENTYLSFWRYVKESPGEKGRIFIDGVTSDGKTFRGWDVQSYLCDQNGQRIHPCLERPQMPGDGWRQYIVNLSPMAGNVINLMIGYDDYAPETGTFTAYFDDIEIRQGYPYSNQWYAEEFGDNNGSTVALASKSGDGVELNYNVWYTYAGELSEWKNGPYLRKNIEPDIITPDDKDIFVNWTQYDYNHSLHYMLLIKGIDNVDRWLIYSANASNHWDRQGWVDMSANQTGILYQDVTYNRNASLDYCTEFGIRAASLKETRVGHFSSTKWSGPSGGYVKDIAFNPGTLALPASPSLTGSYYSVAMSKGIPDPDAREYYAILSWTSISGSYPIQSYQIQAHYTESPTWTDRATVYTGYWRDSDWQLGVIEYRVRSVDSKGNIGPWSNIFKASMPITNDPIIASSTTGEATAFSNGKKIMVDNTGTLHVVFASNDSIYYCTSTDDGNTWSSANSVGQGKNPAIELSGSQKPMVCWSKGNELYRAEKDSLKFTEPQMIYTGPEGTEISYLAYVLDQNTDDSYLGWVDDGPSGSAVYISPYNPNTSANLSPTPIDQGGTTAFKSPSLALDKKGNLKTAWSKNGNVFFNDGNGLLQISNNGIHPIVETYSDKTTVVWQEEILPNIYQVVKKVKGPKGWSEKQLVSYPDSLNADFPVVAASGQYVYCKNMFDEYCDVIWRGDYDNGWQISVQDITAFSGGISKYPTAVFKQKWPQSKLYIVWTEDMSNNSKGSKATSIVSNVKNYTLSVDPVSYYYADAGTEESDIYNYQKSGSFYYGPQPEYTVDYHATELKYNFQNLDPNKRYRIKVVYYHELDKYVRQTLSVDNTFKKKTTVDPMTVCTEEHWIPTSCIMDGQVDVTITKSNGQYAVCSVIALYEYDKDCTNKSGDDIFESTSTIVTQFRYELMQNYPNPNTGKTSIKYQLAQPGKVSLKIYNTLGQVVKTLVSQEQPAGFYNITWDGRDNTGKVTANGVYIYRLEAGDYKATKKMVVIK